MINDSGKGVGIDLGHCRKTKRANLLIIGTEEAGYYTESTDNIFNKIIEDVFPQI